MSQNRNESELESNFIIALAAEDEAGSIDDIIDALPDEGADEDADQPDAAIGDLDLGTEEDGLGAAGTDTMEAQAIKDLIPWDKIVIRDDPHYAETLRDENGLPDPKAMAKSFYMLFIPDNKRVEGVINKNYIGGYGEKEELQKDLDFLKRVSPEGFAPEWKEKILSKIDELPAVENKAVKDALEKKKEESEEKVEKPEEETEKPEDNTVKFPEKKAPEVAKPEPVGSADSGELDLAASESKRILMRRVSRMKLLHTIK
jgi:hypothetical protein